MATTTPTLEPRFDRILTLLLWGALAVGIGVSAVRVDSAPRVIMAALLSGAFVAAVHAVPDRQRQVTWVGELLAVAGAGAALGAIALTGGSESPYLLLSLLVTLFSAVLLGNRVALEIAALSTGGLVLIAAVREQALLTGAVLVAAGLHLVVAVTFGQARRLLLAARQASAAATRAQAAAEAETARIQSAHDLLLKLSLVADATELSPVQAGQVAIENLASVVRFDSCLVALAAEDGPVVVARSGEEAYQHHLATFPLRVAERDVGFVVLSRRDDLDDATRVAVAQALRPLALAFSNILMLQDLARRAVREERTRLARALHDDIGPSLASVGLGLDLAVMQYEPAPDLSSHLEHLRQAVSGLVEEVRSTVTDLRHEGQASLVQRARILAAEAQSGYPQVLVELDERRPPRPSIANDLNALLTEAVRNALRHAEARHIRIEGFVDHDNGNVMVRDDGKGFHPDGVTGRHYGLIGMAERAERTGLALKVDSAPGRGTLVSIAWGNA